MIQARDAFNLVLKRMCSSIVLYVPETPDVLKYVFVDVYELIASRKS